MTKKLGKGRDKARRKALQKWLGGRLRLLIEDQGWTVTETAERMELPREYLTKILNQQTNPGADKIAVFATTLGTTADYLLFGSRPAKLAPPAHSPFEATLLLRLKQIARRNRADFEALMVLVGLVAHYPKLSAGRVREFAAMLRLHAANSHHARGLRVPKTALPKLAEFLEYENGS